MWISVENELRQDPRLTRLARGLKVSKVTAYGYLVWFWQWAAAYCPSGDMSNFTPEEIAEGAGWASKTVSFCSELRKCDFLLLQPDGRLLIENWEEGIMKNQKKAESDKLRMRKRRDAVREQLANSKRTATEREQNCSPYIDNKEHKEQITNTTKTDSDEQELISEFEKEQNSESEINSQKCGASNPKNGENSKINSEVKDSKTEYRETGKGNDESQKVKTLPSLPSGVDFTDLKIPAKLTNLVNTINYSSISSKPPFLDLGKLRDEILSGVLPSLHRGNFDKVDKAKIAEKWNEGITTGEEWMQFFTEISLSTFLQGKKKIPNKNNGECYKTSFSYCIDHFGEVLSGKWRDTPEDTEDIMDSYEKFFGPQVETFDSDDAIECQEYTAEEV